MTLLELIIACAILMILATAAMPVARFTVKRQKEAELHRDLREMRDAIDRYKDAADKGRIRVEAGTEGYPPDLQTLVTGVDVVSQGTHGRAARRRVSALAWALAALPEAWERGQLGLSDQRLRLNPASGHQSASTFNAGFRNWHLAGQPAHALPAADSHRPDDRQRRMGHARRCRTIPIPGVGAARMCSTCIRFRRAPGSTTRSIRTGRPMTSRRTSRSGSTGARGFTMIELMVVIAIILVLAGMAAARYEQSVVRAREAVLKQDLQTMRSAIQQYTLDKQQAPQSLDDLVSAGYLSEIPVDPITRTRGLARRLRNFLLSPDQTAGGMTDVHATTSGRLALRTHALQLLVVSSPPDTFALRCDSRWFDAPRRFR